MKNKDIVILIKTQFTINNPSEIFKKNKLIYKALKKQIIELSLESKYFDETYLGCRNIILPMMSSILSNISICQKYGSTTALEAALVDKRSILINDKKFSTSIDKYLYKDIEFKNLDQALKRILVFKKFI